MKRFHSDYSACLVSLYGERENLKFLIFNLRLFAKRTRFKALAGCGVEAVE